MIEQTAIMVTGKIIDSFRSLFFFSHVGKEVTKEKLINESAI